MRDRSFTTRVVHAGQPPEGTGGRPICPPIHPAVTYLQDNSESLDGVLAGTSPGYVYARYGTPTVECLEQAIAELECTESAVACASGMAALHLSLLSAGVKHGSSVLAARDLYGGTRTLLETTFVPTAVSVDYVDMTDLSAVQATLLQQPRAVVLAETISNPLLRLVDIPRLTELAHAAGAQVVLDNTFAAPCRYAPAQHGVDWVVYSATKYHGGHGDAMAGLVASSREHCRAIREANKVVGSVLGPNDAWLILRGLRTLELRSRQQCANASTLAAFLVNHPGVARVHYPGLTSHPQFSLARRLFPANRFGAVVSFEIKGAGQREVFRFMDSLELIQPATSLGDVYSLLLYPAQASHRTLTENQRQQMGIGCNLVRLSAGIEDAEDLIADLDQALCGVAQQ